MSKFEYRYRIAAGTILAGGAVAAVAGGFGLLALGVICLAMLQFGLAAAQGIDQ